MKPASVISVSIPIAVFVVLSMLITLSKPWGGPASFSCPGTDAAVSDSYTSLASKFGPRGTGRPNLRIAPEVLLTSMEAVIRPLANLGMHDVETSPLYLGTSWVPVAGHGTVFPACHTPIIARILYNVLVLGMVLILAFGWFKGVLTRTLLVMAAMYAVLGWHPTVISLFIAAMETFADWPHAYYLFAAPFLDYDTFAVGLIVLFVIMNGAKRPPSAVSLVAVAVVGQLTFEYMVLLFSAPLIVLGLVGPRFGVAHDRCRKMLRAGGVVFAAGVVTAALATGIFYALGGHVVGALDNVTGSTAHIDLNLTWLKSNTANLITMIVPAIMIGAIVGGLCRLIESPASDEYEHRSDVVILATMIAAYVAIYAIGLFTASYPSEMGRQFMPLSVICVLFGVRLAGTVRRRAASRDGP